MIAPVIGIDGGGSTIRVGIYHTDLTPLAETGGDTVNPSIIGREEAAARIQAAISAALAQAGLAPADISAAGVGIAGAANTHSQDWLRGVIGAALPAARIVVSADYEIALVGAHGRREGVLVLCGTGSLAYGVNAAGQTALAGAWGYLIGDEGSGYWLGAAGLRAAVRAADGRGRDTLLLPLLLDALRLQQPLDVIGWLYHSDSPRMRDVAALAPLVLRCAAEGDSVALALVEEAAEELALAAHAVITRLDMPSGPIAFAGSLLAAPNPLSERLCEHLALDAIPQPRYSPVTGAALLALSALSAS